MKQTGMTLVCLLLALAPAMAESGGEKGDWELGIYGGMGWLDDYDPLNPEDDILFGGRVGYVFTSNWSLEASDQMLDTETEAFTDGLITGAAPALIGFGLVFAMIFGSRACRDRGTVEL